MTTELKTGKELKADRQKVIVYLRDKLGLKFHQIAPQVGLTTRGVQASYYRAKGKKW